MFDGKFQIRAHTPSGHGKALRAFAWAELTARLDAARELRRELKQDGAIEGASFVDAAADYFTTIESEKLAVNHDALSDGNSTLCIAQDAKRNPANGEREI